jgi:hypothetical protein
MKHIIYSQRAVELIMSRMPDEFYRQFVKLYYGECYTLEQIAERWYYSKRHIERISSKVRKMVEAMDDIVYGDVKEIHL